VRFFSAVLVGGAAFAALMPGMPAFDVLSRWSVARVAALVLVGLVIGLVHPHRGWLAAATAYIAGIALWLGVSVHPSPPWAPSDNWSLETWLSNVVGVAVAGAILFAFIAQLGSRLARVAIHRGR